MGKLMRLNLSTGESVQVSQEGTSFLGMWEGRAVYVRNNFYIYQGEETVTVDAAAGLYLEGENGGRKSCWLPAWTRRETFTPPTPG